MASSTLVDHHHLHFLLIPLMSQSHIIPLTDFAKLLARRGVFVSIITTPRNALRYKPSIKHAVDSGLPIQMIPLKFPGRQAGLPQGCENMDSLTSMGLAAEFFVASEMLRAPLETMIAQLYPKPSCIVSTNALPWTQQVADTFQIPRYVFETISCFTLLCSHILSETETPTYEQEEEEDVPFRVPGIPHKIELTRAELPEKKGKSRDDIRGVIEQIKEAQGSARGTLVNSFEELEGGYVEGYKSERQRLWCIGPVSLCNNKPAEKSNRGDKASVDEQNCLISWLDSMKPRSVIYACFGSLCRISAPQIREIGLGLEASNFPFVWIIRGPDSSTEVEKWLEEERFEERVEGRGLVIRGWAPQVLILTHPSVGGFLTHCGWNSTLEGVCAGLPMITWPMFAEQFYNEKFIVHVLRTGIEVGAKAGEKENVGLVKRDGVKRSIEKLMSEDDEGEDRRSRAKKWGEMAKEALEEGGSSYWNISLLIQDVIDQQHFK